MFTSFIFRKYRNSRFNVTTIGRVESKGYETSVSSYIKIKRNTFFNSRKDGKELINRYKSK
jgi:hypothetical protein